MNEHIKELSLKQLCNIINLLYPCMDDYLYIYDFVNDYYYISPEAAKRFCMPSNEFSDVVNTHEQFVYKKDFEALKADLLELIAGRKLHHNMQYRWLDKNGEPVWINCRGNVVRENGTAYMMGCINEIGAKQKADNVSGLLGESSLQQFFGNFLDHLPKGYLLRLGLDDFKEVNERLGTEYGDKILKQTADYISECILPGQKLYRIVSDEFVVLDVSGGTSHDAEQIYKAVRNKISEYVEGIHYAAMFTISGGIVDFSDISEREYTNIMKLSEFSLSRAKINGKSRAYIYNQTDYDKFLKRKELTRMLRQAVDSNFEGFEAYFQPLYHSEREQLYGAEALMRFHSKTRGMVSPGEFIPILEETGLIIPVGRWMLHQAVSTCKKMQQFVPDFKVSVNISYIQLMKSNIINEILSVVNEYEVDPQSVIVELTESGLFESDARFSALWTNLKSHGILIALDDFGTGYSNFHYLYDLRPDIIKIDRSFTVKALENEYEYNLLYAMSGMIHDLSLKVCVEGIETQEEEMRILKISPDYSQGYYYGRPCPFSQFKEQFVK